jgi:hypothetical protein
MRRRLEVGRAYEWKGWIFAVVEADEVMMTLLSLSEETPHPFVPAPGGLFKVHVHSAVAQGAVLK